MTEERTQQDDLDRYIEGYSDSDRAELAAAEVAFDLSILLHRAREHRELSQVAVAKLLGLTQQAVSHSERPGANVTLETVGKYLSVLGFDLELTVLEPDSGDVIERVRLHTGRRVHTTANAPYVVDSVG